MPNNKQNPSFEALCYPNIYYIFLRNLWGTQPKKGLTEPYKEFHRPPLLSGDYVSCQPDGPVPDKVRKGGGLPLPLEHTHTHNRGGPHASGIRHGGPEGKEVGESTRFRNAITAVSDTSEPKSGVLKSITDFIVAGHAEEEGRHPSDVTLTSTSIDFVQSFQSFLKKREKNTGLLTTTTMMMTVVSRLQGCSLEDE